MMVREYHLENFIQLLRLNLDIFRSSTQVITEDKSPETVVDYNKFVLSDVENLNKYGETPGERGQGSERLLDVTSLIPLQVKETKRYVRILTRNQRSGETVASSRINC